MERFLKLEKPKVDYVPQRSQIDSKRWVELHNSTIAPVKKAPKHIQVGQKVFYKKCGVKDPTLIPAQVVSLSTDTCNIKTDAGLILTRLYRDIIV
jgi:hypothetical protein